MWDSAQEGVGDTIHIDYDGDYGSERVLIVSGRATITPGDGSPSFSNCPSAWDPVTRPPKYTVRCVHSQDFGLCQDFVLSSDD